MKTPRLVLALLALAIVLAPGQVVRVEWTADFPDVDLTMCETEVLLSLDGGKTIYLLLTEQRNPKIHYFDWTVPNTPTNAAVLEIRFGCLNIYPETSSLQVQTAFVISPLSVNRFLFSAVWLASDETAAVFIAPQSARDGTLLIAF